MSITRSSPGSRRALVLDEAHGDRICNGGLGPEGTLEPLVVDMSARDQTVANPTQTPNAVDSTGDGRLPIEHAALRAGFQPIHVYRTTE
jgi:hypothetical protein